MKNEDLIQIIANKINLEKINFNYAIYDGLKMNNEMQDMDKVNGIARIISGDVEQVASLGQSSLTMVIDFIYPYERLEEVNQVLKNTAINNAGLVIDNSTIEPTLTGVTGVAITFPSQGNYLNGTMGETARSRIICYFDINTKSVLSNQVKIDILKADGLTYENIPYYKQVITRHRLSTTNKFENNEEMQTVNDGQSIDISLAVPSIKDSVINGIKDDMLSGANIGKTYTLKVTDESGTHTFANMIASGDFSYESVPGQQVLFKILFVYKRS